MSKGNVEAQNAVKSFSMGMFVKGGDWEDAAFNAGAACLGAALSLGVQTHGPAGLVDRLRDIADIIERDMVIPTKGAVN